MSGKTYDFGTYDCFSDPGVCLFVYCCTPCAVCDIASKINAEDTHGVGGVIFSLFASSCVYCSLCCCPDKIWPCFLSSLMDRSMQYHQITVHPEPCKAAKFCNFYCQMYLCAGCTLCVMSRQANKPGPV